MFRTGRRSSTTRHLVRAANVADHRATLPVGEGTALGAGCARAYELWQRDDCHDRYHGCRVPVYDGFRSDVGVGMADLLPCHCRSYCKLGRHCWPHVGFDSQVGFGYLGYVRLDGLDGAAADDAHTQL